MAERSTQLSQKQSLLIGVSVRIWVRAQKFIYIKKMLDFILGFILNSIWVIAPVILASVTVITELINSKLNPNKVWKQVISWAVSMGLTVTSYFVGTYDFGDNPWVTVIVTGLVVGLASNGFYDIPYIRDCVKSVAKFLLPSKE